MNEDIGLVNLNLWLHLWTWITCQKHLQLRKTISLELLVKYPNNTTPSNKCFTVYENINAWRPYQSINILPYCDLVLMQLLTII